MITRETANSLFEQAIGSELGVKFRVKDVNNVRAELYRIRKEIADPRFESLQMTIVAEDEIFIVKPGEQL